MLPTQQHISSKSSRGNTPIGVIKQKHGYAVRMYDNGKLNFKGKFETIDEAFNHYKTLKENKIKRVADEEIKKRTISSKCYEAMMNYIVEITD